MMQDISVPTEYQEFAEAYQKGYSDGYQDTDQHDAEMSYGSQEERLAYITGRNRGILAAEQEKQ